MSERHQSSCSVYNAPAYEPGPCDCKFEFLSSKEIRIDVHLRKEEGFRALSQDVVEFHLASNKLANVLHDIAPVLEVLLRENYDCNLSEFKVVVTIHFFEIDEALDKAVEAIRMSDQ